MECIFETENVKLFESEGKIVGNVSKEEAVKALEEAGVEALQKLDFETTISTAAIAAKVIENYAQEEIEEVEEEDEVIDTLLDIVVEAYEADMLDELFTLTALAHKFTGKSVLELVGQVHEQMLKDKKG
jgi:hypothetical protein